tara:strand:+ start:47 stop:235 length:189 start_codon:yes stop_codon:yes gene_type:complete
MSDIKTFTFHYQDEEYNRKEANIDSRGYKKAVKSFQNKYPKAKNVVVMYYGLTPQEDRKLGR